MKLTRLRITNFQSIWDSSEFDVSDITCLVGKNEAGKTALLKALYRLNPIRESDKDFCESIDYPRRGLVDYQYGVANGTREIAQVVQATFTLDVNCLELIKNKYGEGCLQNGEVTVALNKGYSNELTYSELNVDQESALNYLATKANLLDCLREKIGTRLTVSNVTEVLKDVEQTESSQQLLQYLTAMPDGDIEKDIYEKIVVPNIPKFLYFDEYYQMKGQDNLNALKDRFDRGSLEKSDEPLIGLIELAGLNLEQLTTTAQTEILIARLEAAENQLTDKVLNYWSQNHHLRMKFDIRPGQPEDPPGMTEGTNVLGRVEDTNHKVSTPLSTRSRGFVWFFSFLAWYSQVRKKDKNVILLLDEPGLSLHAKAQADLIRYFEEELQPYHQLIYTTHSPFMVDSTHFDRVRIVQDLSIEKESDDCLNVGYQGTTVTKDVLDATSDSLFPLQAALGYEIHQTLFVGPNCLIVEGASDLLYLQAMSALLEKQGREGLDVKWTITPVGGAGKVPAFVALIGAQTHLNVAVLIDFHKSDRQQFENLYKEKLLKKRKVRNYAEFTQCDEADVEDLFSSDFYLRLVNSEYGTTIQTNDLLVEHPCILYRLNDYLDKNPLPKNMCFNHYRPARYFHENISSLANHLGDEEKNRFEEIFREMNQHL